MERIAGRVRGGSGRELQIFVCMTHDSSDSTSGAHRVKSRLLEWTEQEWVENLEIAVLLMMPFLSNELSSAEPPKPSSKALWVCHFYLQYTPQSERQGDSLFSASAYRAISLSIKLKQQFNSLGITPSLLYVWIICQKISEVSLML